MAYNPDIGYFTAVIPNPLFITHIAPATLCLLALLQIHQPCSHLGTFTSWFPLPELLFSQVLFPHHISTTAPMLPSQEVSPPIPLIHLPVLEFSPWNLSSSNIVYVLCTCFTYILCLLPIFQQSVSPTRAGAHLFAFSACLINISNLIYPKLNVWYFP